jgi:N6-adenosine-specific RNA methylase IME4
MKKPATALVHYAAARRELAAACRVDEVKPIRDMAIAMQVYAKQAKDGELIGYATDIRKRAERRAGQLLREMAEHGEREVQGGDRRSKSRPVTLIPTLSDLGISKMQSSRWVKLAVMMPERFEASVKMAVAVAIASTEDTAEIIKAARAEAHIAKRTIREARERRLGLQQLILPKHKYGVILADPEWRFETWSETGKDRSADNHYPTSELTVIKSRDVPSISAEDCVLFLWATVPMLPQALEVLAAWDFEYVSHFCWIKDKAGTGYWNRNKHELLLIGTRGDIPAPAPGTQFESAIFAAVQRHSQKPDKFYEIIESYFPTLRKIELNARRPRPGWDAWGFEAPQTMEPAS